MTGTLPLVTVVAAALVNGEGRALLSRRPDHKAHGGLWEFPGGKIDPGETPEAAIIRELQEELGICVASTALRPLTFASHSYETFHLLMPVYVCRTWQGEPSCLEGQTIAWVEPGELSSYPMPPADVPLIPVLQHVLGRRPGRA